MQGMRAHGRCMTSWHTAHLRPGVSSAQSSLREASGASGPVAGVSMLTARSTIAHINAYVICAGDHPTMEGKALRRRWALAGFIHGRGAMVHRKAQIRFLVEIQEKNFFFAPGTLAPQALISLQHDIGEVIRGRAEISPQSMLHQSGSIHQNPTTASVPRAHNLSAPSTVGTPRRGHGAFYGWLYSHDYDELSAFEVLYAAVTKIFESVLLFP